MSSYHPRHPDNSLPPGQGHYPSVPASQYGDRRDDRQQPHYDPAFNNDYSARDYVPPRESQEAYSGDRQYAPVETQLAPYDDEIAEAGWRREYEDMRPYTHLPPPPSDHELGRKPRRRRSAEYDRSYDERTIHYDDDSRVDDRERDRSRRRRYSSEERVKDKALRYSSDPKKGGRDIFGGSEGERGLGAKLVGGAGGALLGRKFGKGTLGTMAGAVVGSIAATAIEKQIEERSTRGRRSRGEEAGYEPSSRDVQELRNGERTRAKSGFRERLRSLSRRGAMSVSAGTRRRRRSDSLDSEESFRRERY